MCPSGKLKVCSAAARGGSRAAEGSPWAGAACASLTAGAGTGEVLIFVGAGTGFDVGVMVSRGATTLGCVLLACGPAQAVPASRKPASAAAASERCAVYDFKFSPQQKCTGCAALEMK
jgi:hypothetical protein